MRALVNKALAAHYQPASPASEAFRSLRTNLHYYAQDKPLHSLAVTSVLPDESKSTICNLAISFAQEGGKVLLVDAVPRKPMLHSLFSISNEAGLAAILYNGLEWRNAVIDSDIPNLSVIPAGTVSKDAVASLPVNHIQHLLQEAKQQFQWILIDCPSAVSSADAQILSAHTDGVLLLLHQGKTKKAHTSQIIKQLNLVRANLIGTVIISE